MLSLLFFLYRSNNLKDKVWYLSNHNLFKGMKEDDFKDVIHIAEEYTTDKYKPIYLPGDPVKNVYFIKEGKVKISVLSQDGKQMTIAILNHQDIFGELSFLGESKQTTIAEAIENTYLCYVNKDDFQKLIEKSPVLSFRIVKEIGLKLKNIENRLENIVFLEASERIVCLLLDLAKKYGIYFDNCVEIDISLTHEEIGQLVALNRQTVTSKLNLLKQQGLIDISRTKITIKDIEKMNNLFKSF
jgi:CRP/FNR family cyclic AMP-dependent transcriptional regulator